MKIIGNDVHSKGPLDTSVFGNILHHTLSTQMYTHARVYIYVSVFGVAVARVSGCLCSMCGWMFMRLCRARERERKKMRGKKRYINPNVYSIVWMVFILQQESLKFFFPVIKCHCRKFFFSNISSKVFVNILI